MHVQAGGALQVQPGERGEGGDVVDDNHHVPGLANQLDRPVRLRMQRAGVQNHAGRERLSGPIGRRVRRHRPQFRDPGNGGKQPVILFTDAEPGVQSGPILPCIQPILPGLLQPAQRQGARRPFQRGDVCMAVQREGGRNADNRLGDLDPADQETLHPNRQRQRERTATRAGRTVRRQPRQRDTPRAQGLHRQLAGQQAAWRPPQRQILGPQPASTFIRQFQPAHPEIIREMAGEAGNPDLPTGQAGYRAAHERPAGLGVGAQQQPAGQDRQREPDREQPTGHPADPTQNLGEGCSNHHQNACPIPK